MERKHKHSCARPRNTSSLAGRKEPEKPHAAPAMIARVRPRSRGRRAIRACRRAPNGSAPPACIKRGPQSRTSLRHHGQFSVPLASRGALFRLMATVLEEADAVPAVGAGEEAPVVMEEKVEEAKEAGAGEEKVEEAGAGEEKAEGEAKKPEGDGEQGKVKVKAKKPRSRKLRSEGPHHPPYFEMIKEAIMAAGDGKAEASTYAIAKHVGEQHGEALPGNYRKVLAVQLRNFAAKGRLVRVKASFRLAPAEEKKALASSKKRRAAATKKKAASKEGKKAAPARAKRAKKVAPPAKTKQPRSIRAGVARKANKASA